MCGSSRRSTPRPMVRTPAPRDGRVMEDYEAAMIAEIRRRMAERGESADDLTDAQLHRALRIALVTLAHECAREGGENQPS
jgi:hypothetical protein